MSKQSITIYSNGVTDFQRLYDVKSGENQISIPVRSDYIGDLLDSISVLGDVAISRPASFPPSNSDAGTLNLETKNVMASLAVNLSGSVVTVKPKIVQQSSPFAPFKGTLIGIDSENVTENNGVTTEILYIIVSTQDGIRRHALNEIESLKFEDKEVQDEIKKALKRNFQKIKKNSTFLELNIHSDKVGQAQVGYTIPTAAWKMNYRLRKNKDGFEFHGIAVVDNNTEEDWKDVEISVVTGEPITFSTDIAESKTPNRQHINIVKSNAQGAVEVQEGIKLHAESVNYSSQNIRTKSARSLAGGAPPKYGVVDDDCCLPIAGIQAAETREIGDFSVFKSKSLVTIPAKRSAAIPVFVKNIAESKTVLHYKNSNHHERAFRSIQFKNETEYSLSRGSVVVYDNEVFQGKAIIPPTKQGGEALLPHAVETGVRFFKKIGKSKEINARSRVAKGSFYTDTKTEVDTVYTIKNQKNEEFEVILDHTNALGVNTTEVTASVPIKEKLEDGVRLILKLAPKSQAIVKVSEIQYNESSFYITLPNWTHVVAAVNSNGKIAEGASEIIKLKVDYDTHVKAIKDLTEEVQNLDAKQVRLRGNIQATGIGSDQSREWGKTLATVENRISKIQEELIPECNKQKAASEDVLNNAIVKWNVDL